jgi:hypothetical protein
MLRKPKFKGWATVVIYTLGLLTTFIGMAVFLNQLLEKLESTVNQQRIAHTTASKQLDAMRTTMEITTAQGSAQYRAAGLMAACLMDSEKYTANAEVRFKLPDGSFLNGALIQRLKVDKTWLLDANTPEGQAVAEIVFKSCATPLTIELQDFSVAGAS